MRRSAAVATALALLVVSCGGAVVVDPLPSSPVSTVAPSATVVPSRGVLATPTGVPAFSTEACARIRDDLVSADVAAVLQATLAETAGSGEGGVTAAVLSADGLWSGAIGTVDGIQAMTPDAQMAIGSITKSIVATQVMELVEAGEVRLDAAAAEYLPAGVAFDTNQATIRQLLGMRSGIPDYVDALWESLSSDRMRRWTPAEALALVPEHRDPAGVATEYSSSNYVLLGLILEAIRGEPLADVLRHGVLRGEGLERLILQPGEAPTEPLAMPGGESANAMHLGGGYLPSLAGATAAFAAGGMASDAASLARWWARLCAGRIISPASLAAMTTLPERETYGLGLDNDSLTYGTVTWGHGGLHVGFAGWATWFVADGSIVVVLTNRGRDPDLDVVQQVTEALAATARH